MILRLEVTAMADNKYTNMPPQNMNGVARPNRGMVVVKPKNMRGTLRRLVDITKGHRKGLGWIFILSGCSVRCLSFSRKSRSIGMMRSSVFSSCAKVLISSTYRPLLVSGIFSSRLSAGDM